MISPVGLALALVAIVFSVDLCLPLGVASAVPYTFAVLLALAARPHWLGAAVAVLCCVLTLLKMMIVDERGNTELWKVIANRCLAIFAISMTALLGILRRRAEERLRAHQANLAHMGRLTMLGQVAAGLAHELNQPLAAISLHADLAKHMAGQTTSDPKLLTTLEDIANQAARAGEIVRSIRRMARKSDHRHEAIVVNDIALRAVRSLEWFAWQSGVTLQLDLTVADSTVLGDGTLIEQVIFNLMQNGIEALANSPMIGPRLVTLSTLANPDTIIVTVRDTGPGVTMPNMLFERFHTTKADGLGLGLAISRSIVEAHGGIMTCQPTKEGGAVFSFTLPLHDRSEGK